MKLTKKGLNNLFFIVGVVAVIVMLFTFDVSFTELWGHLTHAGYWLIPIIGIWFVVYGINAWSWRCVMQGNLNEAAYARGERIPNAWNNFRYTVTGYALNYATPVGGLGGEPYRIMAISKDMSKEHATSSVILYAMMHFLAHIILWFTSIFLWLALAAVGDLPMNSGLGIIFILIGLFCLAAFYLFSRGYKNGMVVKLIRWIGKIPGLKNWSHRFMENHRETLENIDKQIAALHKQDRKAFYSALSLEYLSRIVQSMEVMFMLLLFNIDGGGGLDGLFLLFLHGILIMSFTSLFANMIGFLPMQLGVQEGGFVLSIAAMGLAPAVGIFVSIICRVREIIWIFAGILLMRLDKD